MDISALKVNVNSASAPVSIPVVKSVPNSQAASTSNNAELPAKSAVNSASNSSDNKTEKQPVNKEDVQQMTAAMNHFLQVSNANMQVTLHEKTNELMVRFVDTKNGQVLKEFPSHEFLDTMANIREYVGILLDKKV